MLKLNVHCGGIKDAAFGNVTKSRRKAHECISTLQRTEAAILDPAGLILPVPHEGCTVFLWRTQLYGIILEAKASPYQTLDFPGFSAPNSQTNIFYFLLNYPDCYILLPAQIVSEMLSA